MCCSQSSPETFWIIIAFHIDNMGKIGSTLGIASFAAIGTFLYVCESKTNSEEFLLTIVGDDRGSTPVLRRQVSIVLSVFHNIVLSANQINSNCPSELDCIYAQSI